MLALSENSFIKISYLAIFLLGLSSFLNLIIDNDLGWQLLGGQWILDKRRFPTEDFINSFNQYWHNYHWLGQLLFYGIYNQFGFLGLSILNGLIFGAIFCFIFAIARKLTNSQITQLLSVILVYLIFENYQTLRTQNLSSLIIVINLWLQLQCRKYSLIKCFILTVICSNLHVYWIFLPITWLVINGDVLNRSLIKLIGSCLFLLLAPLISPYGIFQLHNGTNFVFLNHIILIDYWMIGGKFKSLIQEQLSPLAYPNIFIPWILIGTLVLIVRELSKEKLLKYSRYYFLCLISMYLAFSSVKYGILFCCLGFPAIVLSLDSFFEKVKDLIPKALPALLISFILLSSIYFTLNNLKTNKFYNEVLSASYPIYHCQELAKILNSGERAQPLKILTHYDYGSWCRWAAYQVSPNLDFRVTSDSRSQWVPEELIYLHFDLFELRAEWELILEKWSPDGLVLDQRQLLYQAILNSPEYYQVVSKDGDYATFIPR